MLERASSLEFLAFSHTKHLVHGHCMPEFTRLSQRALGSLRSRGLMLYLSPSAFSEYYYCHTGRTHGDGKSFTFAPRRSVPQNGKNDGFSGCTDCRSPWFEPSAAIDPR